MAAIPLTAFQPHIGNKVPGVGLLALVQETRNALIEFCERSRVWRVTHDTIACTDAAHTYQLAPPAGSAVAEVIKAFWDGEAIKPGQEEDLDTQVPGWETETATDPSHVFRPRPDQIRIVPALSTGDTGDLDLRVSLKPTPTAAEIEDWLFNEYFEALAEGAVARLKNYSGEPFSDPAGATSVRSKFLDGADRARLRREQGGTGRIMLATTLPFG